MTTLVHVDIEKLGNISDTGSRRVMAAGGPWTAGSRPSPGEARRAHTGPNAGVSGVPG